LDKCKKLDLSLSGFEGATGGASGVRATQISFCVSDATPPRAHAGRVAEASFFRRQTGTLIASVLSV
jgi:hypothetical protein